MKTVVTLTFLLTILNGAFLRAEWTKIRLVPDDTIDEKFYNRVSPDNYAASVEGWSADDTDQTAEARVSLGAGRSGKAVRVDFKFVGKEKYEYVSVKRDVTIDKPGLFIGMWCRFDDVLGRLRLRVVDSSGEFHQIEFLNPLVLGEWRFYSAEIQNRSDAWGGDGNKKIDYPAKFYCILYDRPSKGFKGEGSFSIEDFYFMTPKEKAAELFTASVDSPYGNAFSDEKANVQVKLSPIDLSKGPVLVNYRLLDFWDVEKSRGELSLVEGGNILTLKKNDWGYQNLRIESVQNGKSGPTVSFRADWAPLFPIKKVPASFFGICTHYRIATPTYYPYESMPPLAQLGVKYFRDEMGWGGLEKEKGVFVFPEKYDTYIEKTAALGLEPLLILNYGNKLYDDGNFPVSDEALAGFGRYCSEVVKRYKGKIKFFEVWNEWSGGCGMKGPDGKNRPGNTPENYVKLLAVAEKAIRAANPQAYIIGIGGEHSKGDEKHIDDMFAAGALKYCDAVSVHPYRYPRSPEDTDLVGEVMNIKNMVTRHGGKQNIWITEIGWPTHQIAEQVEGRMAVRTHVLMLSTGVVEKLFWYSYIDDGLNRGYNEDNFGITRNPVFHGMPKASYSAYAVMTRQLTGAVFQKKIETPANALAFQFKTSDGKKLTVAWAMTGKASLAIKGSGVEVLDLMGNKKNLSGTGVELSTDPVYIRE